MKPTIEIDFLYVITTIINGVEKIMIGTDRVPLIYLNDLEAIKEYHILEDLQSLANETGVSYKLQQFTQTKIVDVIEPMKTELTM